MGDEDSGVVRKFERKVKERKKLAASLKHNLSNSRREKIQSRISKLDAEIDYCKMQINHFGMGPDVFASNLSFAK